MNILLQPLLASPDMNLRSVYVDGLEESWSGGLYPSKLCPIRQPEAKIAVRP